MKLGPQHQSPLKKKLIGANATIYAGLTIGADSVIRPGSVVTHDFPAG